MTLFDTHFHRNPEESPCDFTKACQAAGVVRTLVCGGSSGLGKACAMLFAREGAKVAISSRTPDKLKSAAVVLSSVADGKVTLIAGVTADLTGKVKAGELVNFVAQQVGGKGGGKPDMAMAGGSDAAALPAALASVQAWVAERA